MDLSPNLVSQSTHRGETRSVLGGTSNRAGDRSSEPEAYSSSARSHQSAYARHDEGSRRCSGERACSGTNNRSSDTHRNGTRDAVLLEWAEPKRVGEVDRIPTRKPVHIRPTRDPDRVLLRKLPRPRIIVPVPTVQRPDRRVILDRLPRNS